jgi:hypothetical protein
VQNIGNRMKDILNWRKPERSISNGACVEVGSGGRTVFVRDTTDRDGGVLAYSADAWAAFMADVRSGR